MMNRTRVFLIMIPLSIFVWCIFEGFNFRLANWHYITLPSHAWQRWIGYAVAYGTVLPGLCETVHLLEAFRSRYFRAVSWKKDRPSLRALNRMIAVWIGFALILEPLLYRFGKDSLLHDIEKGDLTRILNLLAAGLVCGLLWEFWNFWAQAKWIYTVPFFEKLKLFEMPLLGFLGFPPFAVSAYAMYRTLLMAMQRSRALMKGIFWSIITICCLSCFAGIDRYTVVSYIPFVRDLPGMQIELQERLEEAGIERAQDMLRKGVSGLVSIGISRQEAKELIQEAEIITLKGIGMENYRLLRAAGVKAIPELARQDPELLTQRLRALSGTLSVHPTPHPAIVRLWVREARKKVK